MLLSILSVWSTRPRSSTTDLKPSEQAQKGSYASFEVSIKPVNEDKETDGPVDALGATAPIGGQEASASPEEPMESTEANATTIEPVIESIDASEDRPTPPQPRFSFRALGFLRGPKPEITKEQEATEREKVKIAAKRETLSMFSRSSERHVQRNALAVQRLIVGPGTITPAKPNPSPALVSRTEMTRIKSQLVKPKSANKLIAKLRELPGPDLGEPVSDNETKVSATSAGVTAPTKSGNLPIHAVCLESTEADVQSKHFSKLSEDQSVVSANLDALTSLFSELHIVDLLSAPDLGLGQPVGGKGLLAGAVPTAETVLDGAVKLTPQLIALGFAVDKAVFPDHTTIHPPTDRLSVLTYWWGLELCLPPPTMAHLSQAPSIAHEAINFLSALALMNNGVREVLPFIRYIGQFVDFEWSAIQKQDQGRGVVCAATWIMPAAMVPRPWDFPDPSSAEDHTMPEVLQTGKADPTPSDPLPTLVVTPPSVIKDKPAQATLES